MDFSKMLVLLVDDDDDNLKIMGSIIKEMGVKISIASSGGVALELLKKIKPDLIVLDIIMPELSGFDVCKKISADKNFSDSHIIFLSAKNDVDTISKCFKVGGRDYISKPFSKDELCARIQTQLSLKQKTDKLVKFNSRLEQLVSERTAEILKGKKEIENYNTTLEVLLKKMSEDSDNLAKKLVENLKTIFLPLLEKIASENIDTKGRLELIEYCRENIDLLMSPYSRNLKNSLKGKGFTHQETMIANFIRDGKRTQEMADLLNLSNSTVNWHRSKIREKLGLKNRNQNLQVYLKSLER